MLQNRQKYFFCIFFCLAIVFAFTLSNDPSKAAVKSQYTLKVNTAKKIKTILKAKDSTKSYAGKIYKDIIWDSANEKIAKVKGNKISGVKKGNTYVRGYQSGKKVIAIKITVGIPVSLIKPKEKEITLYPKAKKSILVTVSPNKAANKEVIYSTKNKKVAIVSAKGVVTAVSYGKTVITVASKDGHKKANINVNVKRELARQTVYGNVKGLYSNETLIWYGIPYGASTAGKNRWHAPKAPAKWSSVLDCTTKRKSAAQAGDSISTYEGTEDCLYVNVYRPDTTAKNLPVLVYLHGGGNANGHANRNLTSLAKECNAVVVSVSYRLGAFGFLSHPALKNKTAEENSGNFTLLDIKKSLEWVQHNIVYFGGNKKNVTLSGFSAGARDTMFCVISPIMKGLFHKAISFSGGMATCTPEQGEESLEMKLAKILVQRGVFSTQKKAAEYIDVLSLDELRALLENLSTAEVANMYRSPNLVLSEFPQGFTDGVVLPDNGFSVIASGKYNRVPIILGSNQSEFSAFAYNSEMKLTRTDTSAITTEVEMLSIIRDAIWYGSKLQVSHYVEQSAEQFLTDPAHKNVYGYRFLWGDNASITGSYFSSYIGATHGSDVNFLCKTYAGLASSKAPNALSTANLPGRQDLSNKMQGYIKNFLQNGNPNGSGLTTWKTWTSATGSKRIMLFDADNTRASTTMSDEYLKPGNILEDMKKNLKQKRYEMLVYSNLAGRFFMPEE